MKSASFFVILLGFLHIAQSLETQIGDKVCVWVYKCFELAENNLVFNWTQIWTSEINSETKKNPEEEKKEVLEETIQTKVATASFSMNLNHVCRTGFRLDSKGQCRRVLGSVIERTTEPTGQKWILNCSIFFF